MSRSLSHLTAALVVALAALPSSASAVVLGFTIPSSTALTTPLAPGATSTAGSFDVVLLTTGSWTLSVDDANRSLGTPGRMRAANSVACQGSATALANPLHLTTTKLGLGVTVDNPEYDLGTSAPGLIAHGSAFAVNTAAVSVVLSQAVDTADLLTPNCSYSVPLVWTLTG